MEPLVRSRTVELSLYGLLPGDAGCGPGPQRLGPGAGACGRHGFQAGGQLPGNLHGFQGRANKGRQVGHPPIEHPGAAPLILHQSHVLQAAQVFTDGGLADAEQFHELADARLTHSEEGQYLKARIVPEYPEHLGNVPLCQSHVITASYYTDEWAWATGWRMNTEVGRSARADAACGAVG